MLSKPQSVAIDLIRGGAAQCVLVGHAFSYLGSPLPYTIQNLGVVLFFILSGFLVTASALRKESFTEYFIDRFARMFTPYIPCLILILLAGVLFDLSGPNDLYTLTTNALMLQDFPLHRYVPFPEFERLGTGRPLWSVAMEWWFYMAFGALFYWRAIPRWALPLILIGIFIVAFYAKGNSLIYLWAAGSLGAYVWTLLPRAPWVLMFMFGAYVCAARFPLATEEFYDLTLGLVISFTLFSGLKAVSRVNVPHIVSNAAAGIAAYSYTLYLTHYTVLSALPRIEGLPGVVLAFVVSNIVAIALYYLFERHYRHVSSALKSAILRPAPDRS